MTPHKLRQLVASMCSRSRIDWFLASYPKSGNTWVRFILANYLLQVAGIKEPCQTFAQLNSFLPEFGRGDLRQNWQGREIEPVIVKTHWKYWVGFRAAPAVLVVRNPGDVMVSLYHYLSKRGYWSDGLSDMIRSRRVGVKAWIAHYQSWADRVEAVIHYEELKRDSVGAMAGTLSKMGFELDERALQSSVSLSATETIRRMEQRTRNQQKEWPEDFAFVRDGSTEQWRSTLSDNDLRYINALVPSDFVLNEQ